MAKGVDKLMYTIGLIDRISGPVQKIGSSLSGLVDKSRQAFAGIAVGAAGIAGVGMMLSSGLAPAIEMDRALGEVRSLGVLEADLSTLQSTALEFSSQYGKSASEFVSASYDIQSAIAGLSGKELAGFTKASGILAAATKADTATITSYMGTMYGIFKNQANAMGKEDWVNQIAGQTASAVQMFKTNGQEFSAAFTSLGANATSVGINAAEQMAILGTLQATMSGSEAGTKYKAFLAGAGKAQDALGLKFTDSQGKLLPMIDVLDKIKGKFGDTLSVAEGDELAKAFGTQEAVGMLKLLMADTDGLADSINQLGKVNGIGKAEEMAAAMTDQWKRMDAGVEAVKIGIGSALLPVLNPLVGALADGAAWLSAWTQECPLAAKVIGFAGLAVLGIAAGLASLNLVMGLATLVTAGWGIAVAIATSPITLIVLAIGLLVAAVVGLIMYWDELCAMFLGSTWGQFLSEMIEGLINGFKAFGGLVSSVIDKIIGWLNKLPGVNIGVTGKVEELPEATPPRPVGSLAASRQTQVPAGGVGQNIVNATTNNGGARTQYNRIYTNQPAQSIEQELQMAGG